MPSREISSTNDGARDGVSRRFRDTGAPRLVREALREAGWVLKAEGDIQLFWSNAPGIPEPAIRQSGVLFNHLPGVGTLTTKHGLHATLSAARDRLSATHPDAYDFFPATYLLPDDAAALKASATAEPHALWIRKPQASSRGRGVAMVPEIGSVSLDAGFLVQRYVDRPHLLDGFKYTLRCYVLIGSLDPLVVYLHRDGFAKLASRPYSTDRERLEDRFVHLTNPDVLRLDETVPVSSRNLTHESYRERLTADGADAARLFDRVRRIVQATTIAAREPLLAAARAGGIDPNFRFELLGLDVLVDADLKPWLLECNLSPSLEVEAAPTTLSARDEYEVKQHVVSDLVGIVGSVADGTAVGAPCGRFERIVPAEDGADYMPWFPVARQRDVDEARRLVPHLPNPRERLRASDVTAYPLGDQLVLHQGERVHVLNTSAAYIWMACADGLDAETIAAELARSVSPVDADGVCATVRGTLAEWVHGGLLVPAPARPIDEAWRERKTPPMETSSRITWNDLEDVVVLRGVRIVVRYPDRHIRDRIRPTMWTLEDRSATGAEVNACVEVMRTDRGLAVAATGEDLVRCPTVAEVPASVHHALHRAADRVRGVLAYLPGEWWSDGPLSLFLVGEPTPASSELAAALGAPWVRRDRRDGIVCASPPALRGEDDAGPADAVLFLESAVGGHAPRAIQPADALTRLLARGLRLSRPHSDVVAELVGWASDQAFVEWKIDLMALDVTTLLSTLSAVLKEGRGVASAPGAQP